jgi:hypothetical protein
MQYKGNKKNETYIRMDIEEIYTDALNDPTLLSSISIDAILNKLGENHYLEGKTVKDVSKDIYDVLFSLGISDEIMSDICERLVGYRVVDRICDLRNGRLMRWIKKTNETKLTNGGLLMNVKIENRGVQLLCKNNMNRFFNIRFDDCIIFQKLTMEEQIVLMANGI